jgi:hypothetical protein
MSPAGEARRAMSQLEIPVTTRLSHDALLRTLALHLRDPEKVQFPEPNLNGWAMGGDYGSPDLLEIPKSYSRFVRKVFEVKATQSDLLSDLRADKWLRYLPLCDRMTFAVQEVCLPSGAPESEYDEYEEADYVATPECLDPPTPKFSQTVEEWTGEVVPGEWWLAPPNDWDGESAEDLEQRGQWVFLPWSAKKVPSIHMPRWASRITLEITGVRVERLQDIRPSDIPCEGVTFGGLSTPDSLTKDFEILWDGINAERGFGWAANPWVWVIEFKRVTPC